MLAVPRRRESKGRVVVALLLSPRWQHVDRRTGHAHHAHLRRRAGGVQLDPRLELAELGRGQGRDGDRVSHPDGERLSHLLVDLGLIGAGGVGLAARQDDRIAHDPRERWVDGELPGHQAGILRSGRGHLGDDRREPHRLLDAGEGVHLRLEPGQIVDRGRGELEVLGHHRRDRVGGRGVGLQRIPAGLGSADARQRRHHERPAEAGQDDQGEGRPHVAPEARPSRSEVPPARRAL